MSSGLRVFQLVCVCALVDGGGIVVVHLSRNRCVCREVQLVTFGELSLETPSEQNCCFDASKPRLLHSDQPRGTRLRDGICRLVRSKALGEAVSVDSGYRRGAAVGSGT